MGAELIGYHFVFPKRIFDPGSVEMQEGADLLKRLGKEAQEALEEVKQHKEGVLDLGKKSITLENWLLVFDTGEREDLPAVLQDLIEFCGDGSPSLVRGMLKSLTVTPYRDCSVEEVTIAGVPLIFGFTGEPSWGDEPEGEGYQLTKRVMASRLYMAVGGL
jgi:hypothetical protein